MHQKCDLFFTICTLYSFLDRTEHTMICTYNTITLDLNLFTAK